MITDNNSRLIASFIIISKCQLTSVKHNMIIILKASNFNEKCIMKCPHTIKKNVTSRHLYKLTKAEKLKVNITHTVALQSTHRTQEKEKGKG